MIKFHEHLIEVNSAGNPAPVRREDVVRSISEFARAPENFHEEMTRSEIIGAERRGEAAGSTAFSRRVYYGDLSFEEEIELGVDGSYRAHFSGGAGRCASDFSMQIEEPEDGTLFIRFIYYEDAPEPEHEPSREEQITSYLRRLAYEAKDKFFVEKIISDAAARKAASQA